MDEFLDMIAPYNLWHGNSLPIGFKRHSYTERLMRYTGNRLIKVLTGQRRVGKSYIMRQMAMALLNKGVKGENTLFINRELAIFDFIHTDDDLNRLLRAYLNRFRPEGKVYVFIDEVQDINDWERAINSMSQDYTMDLEVFISGSNSRLLSGELASLLSGRYIEMSVFPFSFAEFTAVYNLPSDRQSFLRYMHEGGLPELINLPDEEVKQHYIAGLRDSIMLKDIVKRYAIKDVGLLENLFAYLVNNASSMISITGIVNYLKSRGSKSSYDTIATYMLYLQEAYLIHKSERYNISGKELLAGNFKAYVNDQAYHNYLFPTVRFGSGYLLEGIVYMELLRKGYKVNTGIIRDKEVDFIATKDNKTLYVQVAYVLADETTAEREYASLESVKGLGEKLLVTLDDVVYPTRNGVRHVQAWRIGEFI
ncbi:MAG: ATP-binding protein [Muribaculaceae bacterium]|nr:ATP-binding protein [Muribaculaceae bacterium]